MDMNKEIQFSLEFVIRLIGRDILSVYDDDLDKARKDIEHRMRHESVIMKDDFCVRCGSNEIKTINKHLQFTFPNPGTVEVE